MNAILSPGRPSVASILLSLILLCTAPLPVQAQSDLCLEQAAEICGDMMLGDCFSDNANWRLLPDQCTSDVEKQIELDSEFDGGSVPSDDSELIAEYVAYIGEDDLYNSSGARLEQPWQVLRQDRANFHRFGISQDEDQWDPLFDKADNRAAMEAMVRGGYIDPAAARILLDGDASVHVRIFGREGRADYVEVDVSD
ncbi:MAG: hypothetical protein ACSHXI_10125 [Hoeflea sp.]|uniref:hypothetical protein n=1 Tax=Hoeflea sp. TaxID=1940281 RepID=UPI003EF2FE0B